MAYRVRVTGLKENVRALRRAGVASDDLKEGFARVGETVVSQSRRVVPVDTGKLRDNIRSSRRQNGVIVSVGGARVPYARYVYYGSKKNPSPVRFIEIAIGQLGTQIEDLVEEALNDAIRKAGL